MPRQRSGRIAASPQATTRAAAIPACLLAGTRPGEAATAGGAAAGPRATEGGSETGRRRDWRSRGVRDRGMSGTKGRLVKDVGDGGQTRLRRAVSSVRCAGLRLAGFEEGDHGEDAAVVVVGLGQVQLGEDAAD